MTAYSIWLVQCGQGKEFPRAVLDQRAFNSGTVVMPFGYVVIVGEGHVALVDTGYKYCGWGRRQADLEGITDWRGPDELLPLVGVRPGDVDTVLVTHAHWDHIGCLDLFPNATLYLQAEELNGAVNALCLPARFARMRAAIDPGTIHHIIDRATAGQVVLVHGAMREVLPGVDLAPAHETHSFGDQYVVVRNTEGRNPGPWVIPGDCVFSFANLEGADGSGVYQSYASTMSTHRVYQVFDEIMAVLDGRVDRLVPVHDADVWRRFPSRSTFGDLNLAEIALAPGAASRLQPMQQ